MAPERDSEQAYGQRCVACIAEIELGEQSSCKLVRRELLEIIQFFTNADKLHRKTKLLSDGDNHPTFRATIEFRENNPRTTGCFGKPFCLAYRILTSGCVQYQENLVRCVRYFLL